MATDGPNICGNSSADNDETLVWPNPEDIRADDATYATVQYVDAPNGTHRIGTLRVYSFKFEIPDGATIDGVQMEIERYASHNAARYVCDTALHLSNHLATAIGDDKANTGLKWDTSPRKDAYGAVDDLWGATLTPAIVNSTTFGILLKAQLVNGMAPYTMYAYIDYVSMTITYTEGAAPASQTRHPGAYQPLSTY